MTVVLFYFRSGIGRNFQAAYSGVVGSLDESKTVLVSPNFYSPSDASVAGNWYDPTNHLAWANFNAWVGGDDPASPSDGAGAACSTYDVYDTLLAMLRNRVTYPNLKTIYLSGHSGGGAFMNRYALMQGDLDQAQQGLVQDDSSVDIRFVAANSPSYVYFSADRPSLQQGSRAANACPSYDSWMFSLSASSTGDSGYARYVRAKVAALGMDTSGLVARFFRRDFTTLQGDLDTRARYPVGDYSCPVLAQGGDNRRDRSYAYWAYKVLLAGGLADGAAGLRGMDVTKFWGYDVLSRTVQPLVAAATGSQQQPAFNHRMCVVPNVGHNDDDMWASRCGKASFTPAGISTSMSAPPLRP